MSKKSIVLYVLAALFAVSGVTALPSGNVAGGVGCLVIAAVMVYFARKKKAAGQQTTASARAAAKPDKKSKIVETIRTKIVGVTFDNEDGENRQDILSKMSGDEDITVEKYTYNGEPAAYVKWGDKIIGNLSADLAKDLAGKYPKARYAAEILEISGGGVHTFGCNIELDIIEDIEPAPATTPANETYVYVDHSSKKYHRKPDCSGMKNAKAIPIGKARKKYTPCKKCCK